MAFGVVVIAAGVVIEDVAGTVIASIGAILITVAVLSIVYDAYLKDVLIGEIFDALEIQQSLQAIDVRGVLRKDQVDLAELLGDAVEIRVLPLDPVSWVHQDWDRIAAYAGTAAVPISVYLPSHNGPHMEVLARRLNLLPAELEKQIARLPDQLVTSWDQKEAGAGGSRLQVILYEAMPAVGVLTTGRRMLLEVPPSLQYPMADRNCVAIVLGEDGWSPWVEDFISDQLKQGRVPAYSRSVMRPLDGSPSPDLDSVGDRPRAQSSSSQRGDMQ